MDNKEVSKKLQNAIDSTNDENSKDVLKGLSDLYTDLYRTRDEAKQYLTESQKKIDEMKKQMETYGKQMMELDELKKKTGINDKKSKSENNSDSDNSNKIKVKSTNNKEDNKNSLDIIEKPEDKEKKYKTIEDMYKEDEKKLRKEGNEVRKELNEKIKNIPESVLKYAKDDFKMQQILTGDISSKLSKMSAEQMSDKEIKKEIMNKLKELDLKTKNNEYANGIVSDLYDGYKKYFNFKTNKEESDKTADKGLEKFKEKINNSDADKVYRKKADVYTINADESDYTEIYNPNMYNSLKSIVDSMYR